MFLLAFVLAQAPTSLDQDVRLKKPVELRLRIGTTQELADALARQTGVKFSVTRQAADFKVTALVAGQPAWRTMDRVADVLRADWQPDGQGGYRLGVDSEKLSHEASYMRAEEAEELRELRNQFVRSVRAAQVPYDQIDDEVQNARAQHEALVKAGVEANRDRILAVQERLGDLYTVKDPARYFTAKILGQFNEAQWRSFLNGEIIFASEKGGNYRLPRGSNLIYGRSQEPYQPRGDGAQKATYQNVRLIFRIDPISKQFQHRMLVESRWPGSSSPSLSSQRTLPQPGGGMGHVPEKLKDHPFAKEVVAWERFDEKDPLLQAKVDVSKPGAPSKYASGYYSFADHLEWLHDQTKLPIVAIATRLPHPWSTLNRRGGTVASYLTKFVEYRGVVRVEQGFVAFRPNGFWRKRAAEVPEPLLRALEARTRERKLSLDDYALLASRLTPAQTAAFLNSDSYLTAFAPYPLTDALPGLRFWATLSAGERQAAAAGQPLPYGRLSGTARAAFAQAVLESALAGGDYAGRFVELLEQPWDASLIGGLSFFALTDGVRSTMRTAPGPLDWHEIPDSERSQNHRTIHDRPGIRFAFGMTPEDSIRYTCEIPFVPDNQSKG